MPKNQHTFKPGQVTNPNGRPKKGWSLTETMREYLSEKDVDKKKERREILVQQTFEHALKGDPTAQKLMWNYIDGMPKQPIELSGELRYEKVELSTIGEDLSPNETDQG